MQRPEIVNMLLKTAESTKNHDGITMSGSEAKALAAYIQELEAAPNLPKATLDVLVMRLHTYKAWYDGLIEQYTTERSATSMAYDSVKALLTGKISAYKTASGVIASDLATIERMQKVL